MSIRKPIEWETNENGCFICTSHNRNNKGYPMYRWDKMVQRTMSRFIYEQMFGEISEGMCVCHICDTPGCINPEHFFLGTKGDNNRDCLRKGRGKFLHGEEHGNSKLTIHQVRKILLDIRPQQEIAKAFGVCQSTISRIRRGERWTKDV